MFGIVQIISLLINTLQLELTGLPMKVKLISLALIFSATVAYGGSGLGKNLRLNTAAKLQQSYTEPQERFQSFEHQPFIQEQMEMEHDQAAAAQWGAPH